MKKLLGESTVKMKIVGSAENDKRKSAKRSENEVATTRALIVADLVVAAGPIVKVMTIDDEFQSITEGERKGLIIVRGALGMTMVVKRSTRERGNILDHETGMKVAVIMTVDRHHGAMTMIAVMQEATMMLGNL